MRKIRIRRPACIIMAIFVVIVWGILEVCGGVNLDDGIDGSYLLNDKKTPVYITGTIDNKSYKNMRNVLYLRECEIFAENGDLLCDKSQSFGLVIYLKNQNISYFHIGQRVKVKGKYEEFSLPENEGQFNSRKYYRIKGFKGSIRSGVVVLASTKYNFLKDYLYSIRRQTGNVYNEYMSEENSGTMKALCLGDKDDLDAEIKELYQDAGIAHILSLSGLHIATVGMTLLSLLIKVGFGVPGASVISSIIMILYGIMTGLSTSTLRALIMFLLGVFAKNIKRTYDLLSALAVSSLFILIENPYYVYDSGFLLSVSAVLGIGIIYPMLYEIMREILSLHNMQFAMSIIKSLCVSLSATIATLPVVTNSFYKLSRYGIFLNLIVVPLAGVVLFIGITGGFLGNLIPLIGLHNGCRILKILMIIAELLLNFYKKLAGVTTRIPANQWICGYSGGTQNVVYIILLTISVISWNCLHNSKTAPITTSGLHKYKVYQNINLKNHNNERKQRKEASLVSLFLIIMSFIVIFSRRHYDLEIRTVSVGQGACQILWGKDVPVIMIDAGSSDVKQVYKYRIEPVLLYNGINKVDYLFISHPDEDHVSGVKEMLKDEFTGITVGNIIMSVHDDEIEQLAQNRGVPISYVSRGDKISGKGVEINILNPENDMHRVEHTSLEDVNEKSIVMSVKHNKTGFVGLFTGDISTETEKEVLNYVNHNCIRNVDLLSIPHHGSKYSSSPDFLSYVNSDICTISAGINNSYGHPHKETLERLEEFVPNTKVFRTDECGQITVIVDKRKLMINCFKLNCE